MSRTFHILAYVSLLAFIVHQQGIIRGYEGVTDQLIRALDHAVGAAGGVFHHSV